MKTNSLDIFIWINPNKICILSKPNYIFYNGFEPHNAKCYHVLLLIEELKRKVRLRKIITLRCIKINLIISQMQDPILNYSWINLQNDEEICKRFVKVVYNVFVDMKIAPLLKKNSVIH